MSKELLSMSDIEAGKNKKLKAPKVMTEQSRPSVPVYGIWGIFLVFVAISIIFANYMVFFGSPFSWTLVTMLTPSTLAVFLLVLYKFAK